MSLGRATILAALLLVAGACAARMPARPVGRAAADPAAVAALVAATPHCRPMRTASTELRLSGRAGDVRVRARLLAGFAEPAAVRLEVLAPFGAPALILASDGAASTLVFPREKQVLREAPVADVLDAVAGLPMDGDELRRVLFGCLAGPAGQGERYGDRWQAVVDGDSRVFLRDGVMAAADHRGWQIEYADPQGGIARTVRVRRSSPVAVDLTAVIGDLQTNVDLDARAFVVEVPPDAVAITLDDLRRSSPLAAR